MAFPFLDLVRMVSDADGPSDWNDRAGRAKHDLFEFVRLGDDAERLLLVCLLHGWRI